jgi:hypothetical protein
MPDLEIREGRNPRTSESGARTLERRRGGLLRHGRRLRVHGRRRRRRSGRVGRVERLRGRHARRGGRHGLLLLLLARFGVPPVVLRRHGEAEDRARLGFRTTGGEGGERERGAWVPSGEREGKGGRGQAGSKETCLGRLG